MIGQQPDTVRWAVRILIPSPWLRWVLQVQDLYARVWCFVCALAFRGATALSWMEQSKAGIFFLRPVLLTLCEAACRQDLFSFRLLSTERGL